jgi:hypothetical protein
MHSTRALSATFLVVTTLGVAPVAHADEGGVSFWLPGQYGSFAAIAPASGWSMPMQAYTYSGSASKNGTLPRGGDLAVGLDTQFTGLFFVPTYTFEQKLFGATPSVSAAFFPGYNDTSADLLVGSGAIGASDSVTGFGDIYPNAQLFWSKGAHNWMTYATGNIPVGKYDPASLSNLGLGHAAIDVGGAYTYLNTTTGFEASATLGFTYNFENSDTNYTNGIDSHLDVGISQSLNDQLFIGAVGYAYVQLTSDDGQPAILGDAKSSVYALGPQVGYTFDVGGRQIYTNLRAYFEFDATHRVEGTAAYLTVNIPLARPKKTAQ